MTLAGSVQPLDLPRAVPAAAVLVPVGRIGAAEAEHQLLRLGERDVVDEDLERQDGDVDVEEEIEVHVRDADVERGAVAIERHARAKRCRSGA